GKGPQDSWAARDKRGNRPYSTVRGTRQVFRQIPSAAFHKTSLAPVVVRWTRPTVLSSEVRANESCHHDPAGAPGRRAVARALAHGHLQRAGGRREPLQERVRPDRRAAQTPLRPDSEPGRGRQGLHGP